ncbi:hypothetical protein FRB99_008273 [Tulasnella sp. 403]|nr:hypothetical protein FRB99_008273 [Tulasnella sp. 403]
MTIDDPSLLVNILGRDLRSVTKERDELLQKDVEARCLSAEVKPLSINKHLELSDALETPYSTFDVNAPGPGTFISLSEYPMSDTSATTPRTSTDSDIPDFKTRVKRLNSLRNLPTIDVPPETIHAICAVGETSILDRHLKQLAQSKIFNLPFFIGESDIEFANPTRQHGYVLRPTLALEPVHNRWSPYTIDTFEPEFPNIFELFVASLRGWYYRGTYRRIEPGMLELPNLSIGEYSDLTTFSKTTLQEQVLRLVDDEEGSGNPADPFLSGEVAVQCIGLQCVGFNTELYRSLVALQPPDSRQDFMSELSHGSSTGTSSFDIDTPIKSPTDSENNRSSISSTASMLIRRLSKTLGHKRIRSNAGSDGASYATAIQVCRTNPRLQAIAKERVVRMRSIVGSTFQRYNAVAASGANPNSYSTPNTTHNPGPNSQGNMTPGNSWRSLASSLGSTVKRAAKNAYEGGYDSISGKVAAWRGMDAETWQQWRERRREEMKGTEKLSLFPGFALKRYANRGDGESKEKSGTVEGEFSIELFVEGYATSMRPPELASRSQKAFMRLAKGFAALPKLPPTEGGPPTGTLIPDDDSQSVRNEDVDSDSESPNDELTELAGHLPPRPDQMNDDLEHATLKHDPRVMSTRKSDPNLSKSHTYSQSVSTPTTIGRSISRPITPNAMTAGSSSNLAPPPASNAELARWHANLDSRLQPFWSSFLPDRTVRLTVLASTHHDAEDAASPDDDFKPDPLVVLEVKTDIQGHFAHTFSIPYDRICTHPSAYVIALRESPLEHHLIVKADLLPPPQPTTPDYGQGLSAVQSPPTPRPRYVSDPRPLPHSAPASSASSSSSSLTPYRQNPSPKPKSTLTIPTAQVSIPITSAKVRLISDIDDTIKRTDVTLGLKTIYRNVFVKGLEELVLPGMADWYSSLRRRGVRFHYVSNSPVELLPVLQEFFQIAGIPEGSVKLKYYGGRSLLSGLWTQSGDRKRAGVAEILDSFPDSRFFLVGDSGEQDLMLYSALAKERPHQILAIFIRDVSLNGEMADLAAEQPFIASPGVEPRDAYFAPTPDSQSFKSGPPALNKVPSPTRSMTLGSASSPASSTGGNGSLSYQARTKRSNTGSSFGSPASSIQTSPQKRAGESSSSNLQGGMLNAPPSPQRWTRPNAAGTPSSDRLSTGPRPPGFWSSNDRLYPAHRSSTSLPSNTYESNDTKFQEDNPDPERQAAEKRRNDIRMRLAAARDLIPDNVILRIFRDPSECFEAHDILEQFGLHEPPPT